MNGDARPCMIVADPERLGRLRRIIESATARPDACRVLEVDAEAFSHAPWCAQVCLTTPAGTVSLPRLGGWPLGDTSGDAAIARVAHLLATASLGERSRTSLRQDHEPSEASLRRIATAIVLRTATVRPELFDDAVDETGSHGGSLVCDVGADDDGRPCLCVDTPAEMLRIPVDDDLADALVATEPVLLNDSTTEEPTAKGVGAIHVPLDPMVNDESGIVMTLPRPGPLELLRALSTKP